jgi:hypothetical protein
MDSALISLIGFSIAMYITPGPNNVMVAASATNGYPPDSGARQKKPENLGKMG